MATSDTGDQHPRTIGIPSVFDGSIEIPRVGEKKSIEIPGHEDLVRKKLAYGLLVLLSGIVVMGFGLFVTGAILNWNGRNLESLIQLFFTSILTLVSTVIGFYFGSEHRRGKAPTKDDTP